MSMKRGTLLSAGQMIPRPHRLNGQFTAQQNLVLHSHGVTNEKPGVNSEQRVEKATPQGAELVTPRRDNK